MIWCLLLLLTKHMLIQGNTTTDRRKCNDSMCRCNKVNTVITMSYANRIVRLLYSVKPASVYFCCIRKLWRGWVHAFLKRGICWWALERRDSCCYNTACSESADDFYILDVSEKSAAIGKYLTPTQNVLRGECQLNKYILCPTWRSDYC